METRLTGIWIAFRRQILTDEINAKERDQLRLDLLCLVSAELERRKERQRLQPCQHFVTYDHGIAAGCHGFAGTMRRKVKVVSPPPFGSASITSNCTSAGILPSAGTSTRSPCSGSTENSTSRMSKMTRVSEMMEPSIAATSISSISKIPRVTYA